MDCSFCTAIVGLSDSEFLKYTLSTSIGFMGAYGAQWLRDWRFDNRVRSSVREGLAEEIANNLIVLDAYHRSFRQGLDESTTAGVYRWPTGHVEMAILRECLSPEVGSLLTPGEQSKVAVVYNHLSRLGNDLPEARDD